MYTPVNPSFTIKKWGLRGSTLYRHVFVMRSKEVEGRLTITATMLLNGHASDMRHNLPPSCIIFTTGTTSPCSHFPVLNNQLNSLSRSEST